ncbi:chitinase [Streptantibioticus parmotrematis]|uniref:chitinase n=1 Tax=Streptantibioticus parmotrematis TaxID=2873249 RepID=UPI00207C0A70|nr:chitinase [Streptantibioticus parmotrematis]
MPRQDRPVGHPRPLHHHSGSPFRPRAAALALCSALVCAALVATAVPPASATAPGAGAVPGAAAGALGSPGMAVAPYFYNGWGDPPDPVAVMRATGVRWFSMAFVLDGGGCDPQWDGTRPLTGGVDQATVDAVRAAGGDVIPSFGGGRGPYLETGCPDAAALAAAYLRVIDAYGLRAIDVDIEGAPYADAGVRRKVVDALKTVKADDPGIVEYVTFPSGGDGPDAPLVEQAAAAGLRPDGWSIMPFDFGGTEHDMGAATIRAAEGLARVLRSAYGYDADDAYHHMGISSENGVTGDGEAITQVDFRTVAAYAARHRIARLTFWSVNRDRPCHGAYRTDDTCSGVAQRDWDFTKVLVDSGL